jgi:hypothetical protein
MLCEYLSHLLHAFWDAPSAEELLGGGGWMGAAADGGIGRVPMAAVYVPHIPGYNRVFAHVSSAFDDV